MFGTALILWYLYIGSALNGEGTSGADGCVYRLAAVLIEFFVFRGHCLKWLLRICNISFITAFVTFFRMTFVFFLTVSLFHRTN
jgi:hypothetical protein